MIVIIDYGMGNLRSVWKAFEKVGAEVKVSDRVADIEKADGVVLPGVGAFAPAMDNLRQGGFVQPVRDILLSCSKPFLGICLGLQLLMEESEEDGQNEGLGIIAGRCRRFEKSKLKVPQMGWNQVEMPEPKAKIFTGIPSGSYFYFVHSYFVEPTDKSWTAGQTTYGETFTSAIARRDRIFALQFHPEKSQQKGLRILENFSRLVRGENLSE
jgi:imidazole glycerol-phosphate synthase subunit HisH